MRRFRRRRAKPLWFPPFGVVLNDPRNPGATFEVGPTTFSISVAPDGVINTVDIGLTFDFGQESILKSSAGGTVVTLSDIQGSAWRLRRMVGNVFAALTFPGEGLKDLQIGAFPAVWFAAGCMVRTVDSTGATNGAVDAVSRDDYDDPWIWRKTWILGQSSHVLRNAGGVVEGFGPGTGAMNDNDSVFAAFPRTNTEYGYVAGGPYIDQKTNRVIGPEERLILTLSTKGLPLQFTANPETSQINVNGVFDFRYVGNLQRSSNRRNASR